MRHLFLVLIAAIVLTLSTAFGQNYSDNGSVGVTLTATNLTNNQRSNLQDALDSLRVTYPDVRVSMKPGFEEISQDTSGVLRARKWSVSCYVLIPSFTFADYNHKPFVNDCWNIIKRYDSPKLMLNMGYNRWK